MGQFSAEKPVLPGSVLSGNQQLTALNRLTAEQREAAFLVYGEGYSYAEAARAVGSPVGLVLTRLTAARSTLI
jgi:RNA polymerase sigma-70 factor (ECF subfamily)